MYFIFCRKKYTKSRQIRHYYGEEEMEELDEETARVITENAIRDGNAPNLNPPQDVIAAPLGSVVEIGGRKCRWCGSTTHVRRSHKDCPQNKKNLQQ